MSTTERPPTHTPSGRRLPFLRKKSKSKDTRKQQQQQPVSPGDGEQKRTLQQQETWPDLARNGLSLNGRDAPTDDEFFEDTRQALSSAEDERVAAPEPTLLSKFHTTQEEASYDLRAPPPIRMHANIETLAGRLFSADHLDAILSDPVTSGRLTQFLNTYRPRQAHLLGKYTAAKKAALAIEYANTVAGSLHNDAEERPALAASFDRGFQAQVHQDTDGLLNEALPAYITHRLTHLVTDQLVKEITQNSAPIMKELIPNLAEVYCITDPSLPDNPIIYASQGIPPGKIASEPQADTMPRVLQCLPVWARLCHWSQLSLPPRSKDFACDGETSNRSHSDWSRGLRDHPELPQRRFAFYESPTDSATLRQQRPVAILPWLPD